MIHYTCDRCKRRIDAHQTRYVVEIDIQSAAGEPTDNVDEDVDQLAELHQVLEGIHTEPIGGGEPSNHHGSYDLCPDCHRQYMRDPLGRSDHLLPLGFSNN